MYFVFVRRRGTYPFVPRSYTTGHHFGYKPVRPITHETDITSQAILLKSYHEIQETDSPRDQQPTRQTFQSRVYLQTTYLRVLQNEIADFLGCRPTGMFRLPSKVPTSHCNPTLILPSPFHLSQVIMSRMDMGGGGGRRGKILPCLSVSIQNSPFFLNLSRGHIIANYGE